MPETTAAFDRSAGTYDQLWTNAPAGRLQREAVWRNLEGYFRPNHHILDLGCGTGEDALWLAARGSRVTAIDVSPQMIAIARSRGVDARVLPIENLGSLRDIFDGAISNFGALNCVANPASLRSQLAQKIRPGGHLGLCVMARFCLWETVYFLLHGRVRKAIRRWGGSARAESLGLCVTYPTVRQLRRALAPDFALLRTAGIGITVPPSFIRLPPVLLRVAAAIDCLTERFPLARALSDHRLLVFVRT